ncbi:MAG: hypothetical protein AAGC77_13860 [Pseudomonadota bacterium]
MKKSLARKTVLAAALSAASLLSFSLPMTSLGFDYPPGVPEGSAPVDIDPATGRQIWMVPDNSDPKDIAALQDVLAFIEQQIEKCRNDIRIQRIGFNAAQNDLLNKGVPPNPKGSGDGGRAGDDAAARQAALDHDPYLGGTILNPQQDTGPILIGGNLVAAFEKARDNKKKELKDCQELYYYSLWVDLTVNASGTPPPPYWEWRTSQ